MYVFQGHGVRGRAWSSSANDWRTVGVDAPDTAPSITVSPTVLYYIARIDVINAGRGYTRAPVVGIVSGGGASALARIADGGVLALDMQSYGKNISGTPVVTIAGEPPLLDDYTEATTVSLVGPVASLALPAEKVIPLSAALAQSIRGMDAPISANYRVMLVNVGVATITIEEEDPLAAAAERFSSEVILAPDQRAVFEYSGNRWNLVVLGSFDTVGFEEAAEASPIPRPHLRGKYLCYYRYKNPAVTAAEGGPLYSDLSPVAELDCGNGTSQITWNYAAPPAGMHVELWRTTSSQAITLYRVATITSGFGAYDDSLTDWELIDKDRDGFAGMPILLPNGELNANRFGIPPSNYAVGVLFQDRLWMGVDTAGGNPNTLRYSEIDEPESMPAENELILQSNLRATDYITALIPYAGALVVMQSRHCHRLTYVSQPLADASAFLLAYRGCLNQRCWDIFEGRVYAMDDQGVYSMDPNGNVENLTLPIYDIWRDKIDYSLSRWFFVRADKRQAVLRVCVAVKGDGSTKFPTRMFVYSFDYKTWWEERYPDELTCASEVRLGDGQTALVYGTSGGKLRLLSSGLTDLASGAISTVTITNPGRGYRRPPQITASGGHGAEFECGINSDGQITGILIKSTGTKYTNGSLTIGPPPTGGVQATATYTVNNSTQPVFWSYKTGCFEYSTDSQSKNGGQAQSRHCSVTYQPTPSACELHLKAYYNNAAYPRSNVAARDRGAGFAASDTMPASVLNMQAQPLQEAESHGVARAIFSGRALDDMLGTDRHVSIALSGRQDGGGRVTLHNLDVYGVNEKGGP